MPSIRSFLKRADRDERPARFIEAILRESSLTVVVRDHSGRFVDHNPKFLEAAGVTPEESGERGQHIRYFDGKGGELSLLETPASVARMTGNPQRGKLFGVRYPNGEERWLMGDMLPLERGPAGWAVLGISADVTDLYTERREAQQRVRMLETLLELARRVGSVRLAPAAAATASAVPLERALPDASLSIAIRQGDLVSQLTGILVEHFQVGVGLLGLIGQVIGKRGHGHGAPHWRCHIGYKVRMQRYHGPDT